jgi:LysM domain
VIAVPDRRRLLGGLAVAVASIAILSGLAPAASPSSMAWSAIEDWYDEVGPATASVGVVWTASVVIAGWLALACLLQLFARLSWAGWARPLADRLAPAALRSLAGASLTASLVLSSPAAAGADASPGTATLHPLGVEEVTTTSSTVVTSPPTPAEPAVPAPVEPPAGDEYTVVRGDSFWTIADERLEEIGPDGLTPQVRLDYWRRLITANSDRLVFAGNPDLLYAGQTLVLPPLT